MRVYAREEKGVRRARDGRGEECVTRRARRGFGWEQRTGTNFADQEVIQLPGTK